jgi:hypothetical protein
MPVVHAHDTDVKVGPSLVDEDEVLRSLKDSVANALLGLQVNEERVLALQALCIAALVAVRVVQIAAGAGLVCATEKVARLTLGAGERSRCKALLALWVELRADLGVAGTGDVGAVPARLALAREGVLARASSAAVLAVAHITRSALPAGIAHAEVWGHCNSVEAGGKADSLRAVGSAPAVEAYTVLRPLAEAVDAVRANTEVALLACPPCGADTVIW